MRPQVIHLVDDKKLGGVKLALESQSESSLKQTFDFKICTLNLHSWFPRRYRADVICLHAAASWRKLPGLCLLRLANIGTPLLYQEHHYSECFVKHRVATPWRFLLMLKLSYRLMTRVLAVSDAQANWMKRENLTAQNKLIVMGQAKDVTPFLMLPAKPIGRPVVLGAYGRFDSQKGFDLLLEAMSQLSPEKVELRLAGGGEELEELEAKWASLPHVRFVGEVHDVPQFLCGCDAVVIPSRWEPFGLTCQESLTAGKTIITSGVDGLNEQLEEIESLGLNRTGDLIRIAELTPEKIVEAIDKLIDRAEALLGDNKESNASLGLSRQARQIVAARWPVLLEKWRQTLNQHL